MRILIADDSKPILMYTRKMLLKLGVKDDNILEASDGEEALRVLAKLDYGVDVVLTDLNMPNLDGLELIERLKADERGKSIEIVVMTGEAEHARAERSLSMGAREYLFKPFTARTLMVLLAGIARSKGFEWP